MAECDICGEEESMPYNCRHCGGTYCGDHRLPESHDCPGLDQWEQQGPVFDSGFEETVGGSQSSESGLADRLGIDTGPGGPLAYFRGNMTFVFLGLMWITFVLQLLIQVAVGSQAHQALFVLSPSNPLYVWTWVTSVFAHGGALHIFVNSLVIFFFGRLVEQYIGSKQFAALFVGSGVLAGLAQIAPAVIGFEPLGPGVVGASGAALALMGVLTIMNPGLTVYLYFIIPAPIWVITGGTVVVSAFFVAVGQPGAFGIAHAAHLVGVLIGLAYGQRVKDRVRMPQQVRFGGGVPGGQGGPGGPGGRGPF
jgi:membrane associated rhomboid family serine protease